MYCVSNFVNTVAIDIQYEHLLYGGFNEAIALPTLYWLVPAYANRYSQPRATVGHQSQYEAGNAGSQQSNSVWETISPEHLNAFWEKMLWNVRDLRMRCLHPAVLVNPLHALFVVTPS